MGDFSGPLVVVLVALWLGIIAVVRAALPARRDADSHPMTRARLACLLGVACVGLGVVARVKADSWSRDEAPDSQPGVIRAWQRDPERYELFREAGTWSIGFGLAVLAVTIGVWVARESHPPVAEPAAPDAGDRT